MLEMKTMLMIRFLGTGHFELLCSLSRREPVSFSSSRLSLQAVVIRRKVGVVAVLPLSLVQPPLTYCLFPFSFLLLQFPLQSLLSTHC